MHYILNQRKTNITKSLILDAKSIITIKLTNTNMFFALIQNQIMFIMFTINIGPTWLH